MDTESDAEHPLKVSIEFPPGLYVSRIDTPYPMRGQQFYVEGSAIFDSTDESDSRLYQGIKDPVSMSLVCGFFVREGQSVRRVFTISDFRRLFVKS